MDGPRTCALGCLVTRALCEKTGRARGACCRPAAPLPAEPRRCPARFMGTCWAGMGRDDCWAVATAGMPGLIMAAGDCWVAATAGAPGVVVVAGASLVGPPGWEREEPTGAAGSCWWPAGVCMEAAARRGGGTRASADVRFSPAEAHAGCETTEQYQTPGLIDGCAEGRSTPADQRKCHFGWRPLPECSRDGRGQCAAAWQPCKTLPAHEEVSPEELGGGATSPRAKLPNRKPTCAGTAFALGSGSLTGQGLQGHRQLARGRPHMQSPSDVTSGRKASWSWPRKALTHLLLAGCCNGASQQLHCGRHCSPLLLLLALASAALVATKRCS